MLMAASVISRVRGVGRRVHDEDVGDAARGAQAGVAVHGDLHQLVGVQAALHHGLGVAAAAHGDADLGGLGLGFRMKDGERADVHADLCGQRLHLGFVADQGGLDEPLGSGFDSAPQGHVRQRPADRRGDGGQRLAALQKLVKDVVVGGMADQGVNGYGFSKGGKIAHQVFFSRAAEGKPQRPHGTILNPRRPLVLCGASQYGRMYHNAIFTSGAALAAVFSLTVTTVMSSF